MKKFLTHYLDSLSLEGSLNVGVFFPANFRLRMSLAEFADSLKLAEVSKIFDEIFSRANSCTKTTPYAPVR